MPSMNFLALVQAAYHEGGFTGSGPVATANQTGRAGDVVRWVLDAHEEIQGRRPDWRFDWQSGLFQLNALQDVYDPAVDFNLTGGVREFVRTPYASFTYPTALGNTGRNFLQFREWEQFRGLQTPTVKGTVPTMFTLRPDGKIVYFPQPTVACTASHEYFLMPQVLAVDGDVPRMPARFHMAIAWKAVMIACGKTKDFARFDTAEENYEAIFQRMMLEETPRMKTGGPLA